MRSAGQGLSGRPWLGFETLTLAPYERRLIQPGLLTPAEREWVDVYQARVASEVAPALAEVAPEAAAWLRAVCAPL